MKIIVFILNALIHLAIAFFVFFMLIIAMNGYSESQANPGLVFYIILSVIGVLGLGIASAFAAHHLAAKTSIGKFGVSAIAVIIFAIISGVVSVAGAFASIILVEAL